MKLSSKHQKRRAQVAIEFLIIVSALVFFVSILLLTIQNKQENESYNRQNIQLKEIALTIQNEINLALKSSDGYSRNFEIPPTSGNQEYEVTILPGIVYINTTDTRHALSLPVPAVIGNINKTKNKIEKINGKIYLNQ